MVFLSLFNAVALFFPSLQAEGQFHPMGFQQRLIPEDRPGVTVRHDFAVGQQDHPLAGIQDHIQIVRSD